MADISVLMMILIYIFMRLSFIFILRMNLRVTYMIGQCIIEGLMSIISQSALCILIVQELMSHLNEKGHIAPVS